MFRRVELLQSLTHEHAKHTLARTTRKTNYIVKCVLCCKSSAGDLKFNKSSLWLEAFHRE